jgi:DnaJ-class molecular chaperone
VLSDEKKRALYDQYGEAGVKSAVGGSGGAYTVLLFPSLSLKESGMTATFFQRDYIYIHSSSLARALRILSVIRSCDLFC